MRETVAEEKRITIRVDAALYADAKTIFDKLGIDTSRVIRLFFASVVREQGIDFLRLTVKGKHGPLPQD
jgi:addiction module RelB/DinJ family antitoxin